MPQYWKGTDNADEGLAFTQERGQEIITDKHGNIKDFGDDKGARITKMSKGDKVYTARQTKMMFDNGLNNVLNDNGINSSGLVVVNQGATASEIDAVMAKHFANIQTNHTSFDKNGIQHWSEKNNNRTIRNANRGSGVGYNV
jgi:hypothetical protein